MRRVIRADRPLLALVAIALVAGMAAAPSAAFDDHVFVVTGIADPGACAALGIYPPWNATLDLERVGRNPIVRHFGGLHYVVNGSPDDNIQVIQPETFETVLQFSVGAGSNPHDILVVDEGAAYVSRHDSRWLYRVHPGTGAVLDSLDLGGFADSDGLPEMSMMARDGDHLFVQIQRLDREASFTPIPPSYLAVIDVTSNQLVDVDPAQPGIQGIELTGLFPRFKMCVEAGARRLYVSTPGEYMGVEIGGIDEINLDTLQAMGYVTSELLIGSADMGAFVMVSEDKGYVLCHTDFTLSSHLTAFSRIDGYSLGEIYVTFAPVQSLAYDPESHQLFFPDSDGMDPGIHVFDTLSDTKLTDSVIHTGSLPVDLVIARDPSTGVDETNATSPAHVARFHPVRPNPFHPLAEVSFTLAHEEHVQLGVYDVRGRLLRLLIDGVLPIGEHAASWDGRDARGNEQPSGLYFFRLNGAHLSLTRKAVLVR